MSLNCTCCKFMWLLFCLRQMIPVAANDVAFSIHAVLLTAITLFQVFIYEVSELVIIILAPFFFPVGGVVFSGNN